MAGRASWKGYLKLSLVSCPVKLYPATSSTAGKISFNMLHKDTLNRVQQKYHDPELGEIDRADLVKGYQFEKDRYVVVTAEELDEIEIDPPSIPEAWSRSRSAAQQHLIVAYAMARRLRGTRALLRAFGPLWQLRATRDGFQSSPLPNPGE